MDSNPPRLADERVLEIVGEKLDGLYGSWALEPGPLLKGPGSLGVRMAPARHNDSFRHVDLEFLLSVDRPWDTSLPDCATGLAEDPELAVRQAVDSWADTTAAVALEVVDRQGRFAAHFTPDSAGGFPGWHTVIGGVSGWDLTGSAALKQQWFVTAEPWRALAPAIAPALDRPYLNGVRLFVGQGGDFESCEVQVNGRLDERASEALAALDWPRTEKMSTARMFLLLVHPQEEAAAVG